MPKYAKPHRSGPAGPRRFSHFIPHVSNSIDNIRSGSYSGKEDNSSEDETALLSATNRSSIGSAGPAYGMHNVMVRLGHADNEVITDEEDRISIPSAK